MNTLVDYADFEYTYERFGYKHNEYCADHVVYVSNGYNFICDYRTDLDDKQSVYTEYMMSRRYTSTASKATMFDIVSKLSNGRAKLVTREDKIKQRYDHDASIGATHTLEQYQEYTQHDNLRDLYIESEESVEEHELNYNDSKAIWTMSTQGTARCYNKPYAI